MELPADSVGLCAICRHCRVIPAARSSFYLCTRAFDDPRFRKYPPLPMLRCAGYERRQDQEPGPAPPESPPRRNDGNL